MKEVFSNEKMIFKVPKDNSYTIFCYSIAEAIYNIAYDKEKPGIYTGVSFPEWSWSELFQYYSNNKVKIIIEENHSFNFYQNIYKIISNNKELIQANFLKYFPNFEKKLKFKNTLAIAKMQISQINNEIYNKFEFFEGSLPGNRIKSLSDTRFLMKQKNLQIMDQINKLK